MSRSQVDRSKRNRFEKIPLRFSHLKLQRAYFVGSKDALSVIASINVGIHYTFKFEQKDIFDLSMREWSTVRCLDNGDIMFEEMTE